MRGILICVVVMCGSVASADNLLVNPGFEIPENTHESVVAPLPAVFGNWSGNRSAIVGAEKEVTPVAGDGMLSFLGTVPDNGAWGYSSDVGQFVDLSGYRSSIDAGLVTVHASAVFNRVAGNAQTDTQFGLLIWAYNGKPGDPPKPERIAFTEPTIITDGNPETWEPLEASLLLPPQTDRVAVLVIAYENVANNGAFPEFDGHYVDDVSLTLSIPEPGTLVMLLIAAVGLLVWARSASASFSSPASEPGGTTANHRGTRSTGPATRSRSPRSSPQNCRSGGYLSPHFLGRRLSV